MCVPHRLNLLLHHDLIKPLGALILKHQRINCESFVSMLNLGEWGGRQRAGGEESADEC